MEKPLKPGSYLWLLIAFGIIICAALIFISYEKPETEVKNPETNYPPINEEYIDLHNKEVAEYRENPDKSYAVKACSQNSGECQDLDADIFDDVVKRIYFPNGDHLDLDGANLDENGRASGRSFLIVEGYDNDIWDIQCYDCQ
ncbi:MAG: hypothetical protein HY764_01765 [Candidatus Portnoybacteria bacterium]|nr:hypothetical protein [Candidatus Portnoybacteria bacterium]